MDSTENQMQVNSKRRIVFLVSKVHFHSPIVLRVLFEALLPDRADFLVVMTPKFATNKKSSSSFFSMLKKPGLRYLMCMALLKLRFDLAVRSERREGVTRAERRYLGPQEVCDLYGVTCTETENINGDEIYHQVEGFGPDVIISVFFNQIVNDRFLALANEAAINVHPSYLPEYRGMSPILWMLAEGAEIGGATIHHMNSSVDTGNIIDQERFPIEKGESFFSLYRDASVLAGDLLVRLLSQQQTVPEGAPQVEGKTYRNLTSADFRLAAQKAAISALTAKSLGRS